MNTDHINHYRPACEAAAHEAQGVEFWFARDLQTLLGYTEWRNFLRVVEKAVDAAQNSDQSTADHFAGVSKMVKSQQDQTLRTA